MRLELGKIHIRDIQFANESKIEANVLYVNKEELIKAVWEDEAIASVDLEIARPGESVRITPVKDVIEPRVKVEVVVVSSQVSFLKWILLGKVVQLLLKVWQ